jgi:hypothetical protein
VLVQEGMMEDSLAVACLDILAAYVTMKLMAAIQTLV